MENKLESMKDNKVYNLVDPLERHKVT